METHYRKTRSKVVARFLEIEFYCDTDDLFSALDTVTEKEPPRIRIYPPTYISLPRFVEEKNELVKCIKQLKNSFEDLQDRQVNFVTLKTLLENLRNKVTLENYSFLRLINMCIDALNNTKSETISIEQVEALGFVLQEMNEMISEYEVNQFQEILLKSGLKPMPGLEGIAELYK